MRTSVKSRLYSTQRRGEKSAGQGDIPARIRDIITALDDVVQQDYTRQNANPFVDIDNLHKTYVMTRLKTKSDSSKTPTVSPCKECRQL